MSTAQDKILELIAAGKITPQEGEQLLRSLRPPRRSWWRVALHPFDMLSARAVWSVAISTAVLSMAVALLARVRFDGALDMHLVAQRVSWVEAGLDQLVAWPLTAFVLWLVGLVAARQSRLLDFIAFVGAARATLLLTACIAAPLLAPVAGSPDQAPQSVPLLSAVVLIPFLVWFIALLVAAVRTASGVQGGRLAAAVIAGIVAAEAISKVVLGLAS